MKFKSVSPWLTLVLLALSGAAHADLEPFSFGASEQIKHDDNVGRTSEAFRESDWISTTEFDAALDQAIGRQRLTANGSFDVNRYKNLHRLDANTYDVAAALDWSTIGDLNGAIGADSSRHQYFYGLEGEAQAPGATALTTRNLQTDNHVYANAQLGGLARWSIFTGVDANDRKYSNPLFATSDERQWSAHGGTSYSTSPDLSFGLQAYVTHGTYPNFAINGEHDDFNTKSVDLTTKWQVSGVSALDASVGYTRQEFTSQSPDHFVNGSLNWTWSPPSHFQVIVGISRDSSVNTGEAAATSVVAANNLTGRSINTGGHLTVSYELTPKTSLVATAQYTNRRYDDSELQTTTAAAATTVDGSNRTAVFNLGFTFKPTRTTNLGCNVAREIRNSDASIELITPAYSDTSAWCTAAIHFD